MRLPNETTEQCRKIEQVQHGRKQANRMIESDFSQRWLTRHRSLAYVTAIVLVAIAVILTALMSRVFTPEPIGLLLLSAVIATAWLAGFGPALLAIALGIVAFVYDITPSASFSFEKQNLFVLGLSEASRLSLFIVVSLIVSSVIAAQSKATEAVRRSRDELQAAIEGLRRTESALLKAETYLTEAQRLHQTGSFGWNVSLGEIVWSEQAYRIFGVDRTAKPTLELILERTHPDDRAAVQGMIDRALGDQKDFEHQYRLLMPDGSVKHIHAMAHATTDASGTVEFVGAVSDVTAGREAERRLRLSEAYLAESQHLSHTSSWTWDERRQEYVYLSDEIYHLFGIERGSKSDLVETYHDLMPPEDKARMVEAVKRAIRDRTDLEVDFRIRLPDGTTKHVHSVGHPVLSSEGKVIQLVGTNVDVTEQYEAKEKLQRAFDEIKRSQDHLRLVIDTIPTLVWRSNPAGVPDFLNKPALDYTGLAPGEIALDWRPAFNPRDKKDVYLKWAAIRESGKRGSLEARLRRFDGEYRWFVFEAEPLRDQTGNIVSWYGSATDIEDRKLAELSLREAKETLQEAFDEIKRSQDHLRLVIDTIPTLVWRAGPDGVPDFLNKPALDYTGLSPGEIEFGWPRAFHPEDKKYVFVTWSTIRQSGRPGSLEARLRRFDGEYRWFLFEAEPLRDQTGTITSWYGSATDIEDRKLAELSLRESEQRFRDYAETASDWLWETGPDHKITRISDHINVVGFTATRLPGVTRWQVASDVEAEPEKWRRHREMLDAHLPFRDFVYSIINDSGSQVYVRSSGKPVFDADGHFLGYRGSANDITASIRAEQAEEALRKAQTELAHVTRVTMLGELTASIAHEVNQPLTAVVTNAEASLRWLNRETPDLAAVRRSVESVINDGCRASDVIRRVRALAKKSDMEAVKLDLNQVANEAIALVERELAKHEILLHTDLAPALPEILADRVQLQQVIINLLMNGIEAMEPITDRPRELLIRSGLDDAQQLTLSVTDSGIGISAESANRLFNAFFTTKSNGLGMGLSICRSIVEAHGGRMFASPNDGPGATFQFALPLHQEDV
jgi:PAS domain S-box-containing protein